MLYIVIGALIIGVLLGLMGSGGSILTVPVLVYLLGHNEKVAVAESLAIVGGIAALAAIPYARTHLVDWRSVLFFGVPGMLGTYLGASLARFVPGTVQLLLFAVVMLLAAFMMLRKPAKRDEGEEGSVSEAEAEAAGAGRAKRAGDGTTPGKPKAAWLIGLEGLLVGILTGLVGVGGGFLVVPALVLLGKLPMRVAVGTSLAVIALKSMSGFYKYLDVLDRLDLSVSWSTVGAFIAVGVAGGVVGHRVASQVNQQRLRQAFAVFLVVMGLFVLGKEAPKMLAPAPTPPAHSVAEMPVHSVPDMAK